MSKHSETSKEAALRAVGRTVVNFQQLEHNLKLAAQMSPAQGIIQKIQRDLEKRKERAGALTLGQAIQAWLNYLEGDTTQPAWTPDLFDYSVRMTFSLDPSSESPDSHAQALRSLLDTRNSLIHTRLARFPWDSAEACERLVAELDIVNASVVEQLDYVAALLREIEIALEEHAQAVMAAFEGTSVPSTVGDGNA